ncbi:MAG: TetR/AcrR family transcriptional regulator [Actinomycetes bacterium]
MARASRTGLREQILDSASASFASKGFLGTSLQDIARDAGCSKAALLYHFESKMAILAELIRPGLDALAELDRSVSRLRPEAAQRAAVEGFVDVAVRNRMECAVLFGNLSALFDDPRLPELRETAERLRGRLSAGSPDLERQLAALVALTGVAAACAEATDVADDDLRGALLDITFRVLL